MPKQLNRLGFADSETSGIFSADPEDIQRRKREIRKENEREEHNMLERLNEANREADRSRGEDVDH